MKSFSKKVAFSVVLASFLLAFGWVTARQVSAAAPGVSPERQKRLESMKSKGPEASLTILPVRLGGNPADRVSEVVGLLLEKKGLKHIELGKTAFDPGDKTEMERMAAELGEFVRNHPVTTDYALYAEYKVVPPSRTFEEIRGIVVDKTGAVVWTDRLTSQDEAFKKLDSPDPMTLSYLLTERLAPPLGLTDETAKAAKPGKMASLIEARSGIPPAEERAPLPGRLKEMKESRLKITLMVFPPRIGGKAADPVSATDLARAIQDSGLCKAVAAKQSVLLASARDSNELKTLWDLAREFREYVRKNPTDADYILYADYGFSPENWERGMVHLVVCNRLGEWVIVDMQNSHHADYQAIKPVSREGCDQLLLKRLEGYLRGDASR